MGDGGKMRRLFEDIDGSPFEEIYSDKSLPRSGLVHANMECMGVQLIWPSNQGSLEDRRSDFKESDTTASMIVVCEAKLRCACRQSSTSEA